MQTSKRKRVLDLSELEAQYCEDRRLYKCCVECARVNLGEVTPPHVKGCPNKLCLNPHAYLKPGNQIEAGHFCYCTAHKSTIAAVEKLRRARYIRAKWIADHPEPLQRHQWNTSWQTEYEKSHGNPEHVDENPAPVHQQQLGNAGGTTDSMDVHLEAAPAGLPSYNDPHLEAYGSSHDGGLVVSSPSSPVDHMQIDSTPYHAPVDALSEQNRRDRALQAYDVAVSSLSPDGDDTPYCHELRCAADYGLYDVLDSGQLDKTFLRHVRLRYVSFVRGEERIPVLVCDCQRTEPHVSYLLRTVLREREQDILRPESERQSLTKWIAETKEIECVHSRYVRNFVLQHDIEVFKIADDAEEAKFHEDSFQYLRECDWDQVVFQEPGFANWTYSVAVDFPDTDDLCQLRGLLRVCSVSGSSEYLCQAEHCKSVSVCAHKQAAANMTEICGDNNRRGTVLPDRPEDDEMLCDYSSEATPCLAALNFRRSILHPQMDDLTMCICSFAPCRCRIPCIECKVGYLQHASDTSLHSVVCYDKERAFQLNIGSAFQCSACKVVGDIALAQQGLVSITRNTCVTLQLLRDFHLHVKTQKSSIAAYHKSRVDAYGLHARGLAIPPNLMRAFLSRSLWTLYAWSYITRLQRDYKAQFTCPICGTLATSPLVSMDGTALGCNSKFAKSGLLPLHEQLKMFPGSSFTKGIYFDQRLVVGPVEIRQAILELHADFTDLSSRKKEKRIRKIRNLFSHTDASLSWVRKALRAARKNLQSAGSIIRYMAQLAQATPVPNGLVKDAAVVRQVLEQIVNQPAPRVFVAAQKARLLNRFPSLERLLQDLPLRQNEKLPTWLLQSFERLIPLLQIAANGPVPDWEEDWKAVDPNDDIMAGCWFSGSEESRRWLKNYEMPTRLHGADEDETTCTKNGKKAKIKTPGIFIFFCPHGVALGFSLMRLVESPHTPFAILYNRFRKAPVGLIYDNGCKLHAYAMNREPAFFKNTAFFIDRLHQRNHVGCSEGYNLDKFPCMADVNSMVAEQANAMLLGIRGPCGYMLLHNFGTWIRFYIGEINQIRIDALNSPVHTSAQRRLHRIDELVEKLKDMGWGAVGL